MCHVYEDATFVIMVQTVVAATGAAEPGMQALPAAAARKYPLDVTLAACDIPPGPAHLGPNVQHVNCARDGRAADVLAEMLDLPQVC
jgi:hypothetical protein